MTTKFYRIVVPRNPITGERIGESYIQPAYQYPSNNGTIHVTINAAKAQRMTKRYTK